MTHTLRLTLIASLLVSLVFTVAPVPTAQAASFVVNSLLDNNISGDSLCTLREAIETANNAGNGDCGTNSTADDTITFSVSGTITLGLNLPNIVSGQGTLTINGGSAVTISGNNLYRVFIVDSGANLTLQNVTIANGFISGIGAGVYNSGTLTITNSTISGNSATTIGGGIYNSAGTTTTITNSTFSGNSATTIGGGIYNSADTTTTITNSTFSGNSSTSSGGGISNGGTLTVSNSTFSGNSAAGPGGGINNGGTLTVSNSTFSNNSATSGGGIRQAAGTVTLKNTIVANSTSGGNCSGTITDGGNNLDSANTCGFTTNAKINTNPNLGALTGSPAYFPLNTGSAAIDAGDNTVCAAAPVNNTSQNGVTRPLDGDGNGTATCDIGSYEAPTVVVAAAPALPDANFDGSVTVTNGDAFYINSFFGHVHVNTYGNHFTGAVKIISKGTQVCIEVPAGYEIIGASCYTDKEGGRKDFYIKPKTTQPQTITLPNGFAVGASGGIFNLLPWSFTVPANVLGNNSIFKLEFFTGVAPNAPNGLRLFARVMNAQVYNSAGTEIKTFNPPLQLCYTFSDAELQSVGGDAKNFVILTSSDGKTWEELVTTVDTANKKVCASVTHFSLFEMSSRIPTKIPTTGEASMPWWMWVVGLLGGGVVGWLATRRRKLNKFS